MFRYARYFFFNPNFRNTKFKKKIIKLIDPDPGFNASGNSVLQQIIETRKKEISKISSEDCEPWGESTGLGEAMKKAEKNVLNGGSMGQ